MSRSSINSTAVIILKRVLKTIHFSRICYKNWFAGFTKNLIQRDYVNRMPIRKIIFINLLSVNKEESWKVRPFS